MSWWTPPGSWLSRTHTTTGARNMREHRLIKREQAEARQALETLWRTLPPLPAEAPVKRKRKRKRKRAKKNKGSVLLAAIEARTEEWLETDGPGVDF